MVRSLTVYLTLAITLVLCGNLAAVELPKTISFKNGVVEDHFVLIKAAQEATKNPVSDIEQAVKVAKEYQQKIKASFGNLLAETNRALASEIGRAYKSFPSKDGLQTFHSKEQGDAFLVTHVSITFKDGQADGNTVTYKQFSLKKETFQKLSDESEKANEELPKLAAAFRAEVEKLAPEEIGKLAALKKELSDGVAAIRDDNTKDDKEKLAAFQALQKEINKKAASIVAEIKKKTAREEKEFQEKAKSVVAPAKNAYQAFQREALASLKESYGLTKESRIIPEEAYEDDENINVAIATPTGEESEYKIVVLSIALLTDEKKVTDIVPTIAEAKMKLDAAEIWK